MSVRGATGIGGRGIPPGSPPLGGLEPSCDYTLARFSESAGCAELAT